MDCEKEIERKPNPKLKANCLSLTVFFYTVKLLKYGRKHEIEKKDIYEVMPKFKSSKLGDKVEKEWKKQAKLTKFTIFKVLWQCFGKYYLFLGLVQFIMKTIVIFVQPNALAKLVSYFTSSSTMPKSDAYYYATVLIVLNIVHCTYAHNYMLWITELGIQIKTAFCSLIYRKALKLNHSALSDITIGKIVTLISKDVNNLEMILIFLNDIWISVLILIITSVLIYRRLGEATFAGLGFLLAIIPLQIFIGKLTSNFRLRASKVTDQRIQRTQEALSAIKIIKMYTWEKFYSQQISDCRKQEIDRIKKIYYAKATTLIIGGLILNITMYIIVSTYTSLGNFFTAEVAFYLLSCLQNLRSVVMVAIPLGIAQSAEAFASLTRINNLLLAEEIIEPKQEQNIARDSFVLLKNVSVHIKKKPILHNIDLLFYNGLYVITGRVGGGKSSLMKTILRTYNISAGELKVQGSVSYAAEEPWLFPSSLRQNILFGEKYDAERFRKVLEVCALKEDVDTFEHGDEVILDDRGMNLSKGQQARVSLARAVYKDSDIYLLDDCLTSLDAHVQEFVFKECIQKFLKGKVVLMISHNENMIRGADRVLIMEDGYVKSFKQPANISREEIEQIFDAEEEVQEADVIDSIILEDQEEENAPLLPVKQRKLIYDEQKKIGNVDFDVYKKYFRFGGPFPVVIIVFGLFLTAQVAFVFSDKLVTGWVNIQQNITEYKVKNDTNSTDYSNLLKKSSHVFTTYTWAVILSTCLFLARAILYFNFSSRASVNLHKKMAIAVINAKMQFFDSHYIGNIINRFSKDLGTIDEYLPFVIYECARVICAVAGIFILVFTVNPIFIIPALFIFAKLFFIRRLYIPTARSLKRLDSATRSPVLGYVNATLEGLTTIHSFGTEEILRQEFDKHQDLYTSTYHMAQCTQRTFAFFLDLMCQMFITGVILKLLIFYNNTQAGEVGLAISQSQMLTGMLQWAIRQWAEVETQMTSVERILEYSNAEPERIDGKSVEKWPSDGKIVYKNVNLTYGTSKELVLKDINFEVNPGEKIGIVGRTGAGKSSLISTLFSLYEYEGKILIDNVTTSTLSLKFLRSNIAIIPQDPMLFSGTLRQNIDPTGRYEDHEIWKAIRAVGMAEAALSLEEKITENGSNFSSGQKQLLCLARAIVSKNKIIVLDEATANMDPETDLLIHQTIRKHFEHCTVLTIAHRLHSVLECDKILVVDKGAIVEFDAPQTLLENKESLFYKMVKRANLLQVE